MVNFHFWQDEIDIQLIHTVCQFCVYELVYSFKFICNPKSILKALLWSFADVYRAGKNLSHLYTFLAEIRWCSVLTLTLYTNVFLTVHLVTRILVISLTMALKCRAEVLPTIPKFKKTMI